MFKLLIIPFFTQILLIPTEKKDAATTQAENFSLNTIFVAYNDYKENRIDSCVEKLESIGLNKVNASRVTIPKDIHIDTLAFQDSLNSIWVFFRSVDLEYIKTVKGFVTFETENPKKMVKAIIRRFEQNNINLAIIRNEKQNEVILKDYTSFVALDRRWAKESYSSFESFYTFTITTYDKVIDISFEEIVPKDYVVDDNQFSMNFPYKAD